VSIQPPAIARVLDDLAPVMAQHRFRPVADRAEWTGKFNIFSWERRGWKVDLVRLGWRKSPISTCFLDAQWSVPRASGDDLPASGLNASYSRRQVSVLSLPPTWPLIGPWFESRWRAAVVADAEHALAWSDRCDTRAGALEELVRPERNGPHADSEAYRYIEQYIKDHSMPG
jgi:hypothetical protein